MGILEGGGVMTIGSKTYLFILSQCHTCTFAKRRFQVPEMRENMLNTYAGKWAQIAQKQMKTIFNPAKVDMQQQAKR